MCEPYGNLSTIFPIFLLKFFKHTLKKITVALQHMTQKMTYNGLLETHCRNGRQACPVPGFGFCSVLEYSLHTSGLFLQTLLLLWYVDVSGGSMCQEDVAEGRTYIFCGTRDPDGMECGEMKKGCGEINKILSVRLSARHFLMPYHLLFCKQ